MLSYILMVVGFVFIIKGANFLIKGASSLGRRLRISELAIGLTIVAFGTSMPELFVNITASVKGDTEIAIGNILGSNIANILLILGVSAIIYPLSVSRGTVWKEIPLCLLAAVILAILANDRWIDQADISALSRIDGLILLGFFIIFICYTAGIAKAIEGTQEHVPLKQMSMIRIMLYIVGGLVGLGVGGKWIVDGAVYLAGRLGVSESSIGLTIVAMGTSLPELATSTVAAYKKNVEIAVGNIVGSNIFNIFFILGISAVIKPLPFQAGANIDIAAVIVSSVLLFTWMFTGKKRRLDRWEGAVFVALYTAYITFLIIMG